ncbi:MAG: hypothetical protein H0W61_15045 [Bacteroidetes bacterium]|nr:hypothetical protein [Bacteroidota bacterium]
MKKDKNILEQFENLTPLEPSAEWDKGLWEKLDRPYTKQDSGPFTRIVLLGLLFLLSLNVYYICGDLLSDKKTQTSSKLKTIASEYLISTNSSNY